MNKEICPVTNYDCILRYDNEHTECDMCIKSKEEQEEIDRVLGLKEWDKIESEDERTAI